MKKRLCALVFLLVAAHGVCAQNANLPNMSLTHFTGVPSGGCAPEQFGKNDATGDLYDCLRGAWHSLNVSGSGVPGGPNNSVQTNATGTFSGRSDFTVNASTGLVTAGSGLQIPAGNLLGNVFLMPGTNDGIQYVGFTGANDLNNGLSAGSSVATIYKAWLNLPGAPGCQFGGCGGTIVLGPNAVWGGPITGQGLQILGPADPNYASPPSGWLVQKAVKIECGTGGAYGSGASGTQCNVSGNNASHYGIWLAGTDSPMEFDGIKIQDGKIAVITGLNSNGAFSNTTSGSVDLTFNNDYFGVTPVATNGPSVLIGPNSFEISFHKVIFNNNPAATPGTEAFQAMAVDSEGFTAGEAAYVSVIDSSMNEGGLVCNGCQFLIVHNLITEGQSDGRGAVWFVSGTDPAFDTNDLSFITVADNTAPSPSVENDAGPGMGIVTQGLSAGMTGPGIIQSSPAEESGVQVGSPLQNGQQGFLNGWVFGKREDVERNFGVAPTRFANQTSQGSLTGIGFTDTITFATTGFLAPDGSTNAGQAAVTSGSTTAEVQLDRRNRTLSVGDTIVVAMFVRSVTANGYSGGAFWPWIASASAATFSTNCTGDAVLGDGEWVWSTCQYTVTNVTSNPSDTFIYANFDSTHTLQFYKPLVQYIPAGTLSNNEIAAYVSSLKYTSSSCSVGQDCGSDLTITNFPGGLISQNVTVGSLTPGNCVQAGTSGLLTTTASACGSSGSAFSGGLGASFQDATEIAAPANPAAGNDRLFFNSTTHLLDCHTSSGASCVPSGSGTPGTPLHSLQFNSASAFAGTSVPATNGQYAVGYTVTAGAAVDPTVTQLGSVPRIVGGTTSTDTIAFTDNLNPVIYNGSVAVATALPTPTTLGNTGFTTKLINNTSGSATAVTVTSTTLTFDRNGTTTLTVQQGEECTLTADPGGTKWDTSCHWLDLVAGSNITITPGQFGPTIAASSGGAFSGGLGASFQDATEIAAPANPSAGNDRLFLNSSTHLLDCHTSAGATCMPSSGGLSGLTANTIPIATSPTAIGNGPLSFDGTGTLTGTPTSGTQFIYTAPSGDLALLESAGTANAEILAAGTGDVLAAASSSAKHIRMLSGVVHSFSAVTFSATPTFNAGQFDSFEITLTGNVTSSTVSNPLSGEWISFIICQDATGSRTFAWPANFKGTGVIGSAASTCSSESFMYDGTSWFSKGAIQTGE